MKTLQEIKDEYARSLDNGIFKDWESYIEFNEIYDEDLEIISKRFAREVAKEALRNASKSIDQDKLDYVDSYDYSAGVDMFPNTLNIESILDENNIPKL